MRLLEHYQERFRSFLIRFVRGNPKSRVRILIAYNLLFVARMAFLLASGGIAYLIAFLYRQMNVLSARQWEVATQVAVRLSMAAAGILLLHLLVTAALSVLHPSSFRADSDEDLFSFLNSKRSLREKHSGLDNDEGTPNT